MKIRRVGAEFFRGDRRTDRPPDIRNKANSRFFRKFANAPNRLMLYSEIVAVCSEIRTKRLNTLCGQNVEFMFKAGVM